MDARFRGLFFASAGFLFASIGFTLSVLSTLLRLLLPYHPTRGADVASTVLRRRSTRRSTRLKHRRTYTSTADSSISSATSTSTSSSLESCSSTQSRHSSTSEMKVSKPQSLEPTSRNAHNRVVSEHIDRPDFRNTAQNRHRRSDSAPPSPAPWASSHSDATATARTSVDDTALDLGGRSAPKRFSATFHLPRAPSFDAASSLDDHSTLKGAGLSFLHRRKVRKAGSLTENTLNPPAPAPPHASVEKRTSQLLAPLLHRRRSQHVHDEDVSPISAATSPEEENAPESRPSQESHRNSRDMTRVLPKRSQTLRTQPYEAPYFFPTPGSVEAENYLPPRRKPVRGKTLSPDDHHEVEHGQPQEMRC